MNLAIALLLLQFHSYPSRLVIYDGKALEGEQLRECEKENADAKSKWPKGIVAFTRSCSTMYEVADCDLAADGVTTSKCQIKEGYSLSDVITAILKSHKAFEDYHERRDQEILRQLKALTKPKPKPKASERKKVAAKPVGRPGNA